MRFNALDVFLVFPAIIASHIIMVYTFFNISKYGEFTLSEPNPVILTIEIIYAFLVIPFLIMTYAKVVSYYVEKRGKWRTKR